MLISIIIAPPATTSAPAVLPAKPKPLRLEELDRQLLEEIRAGGRYGTGFWTVVDRVAAAQGPTGRADARAWRLEVLKHLRWLLQAQVVFMFGKKYVTSFRFPKAQRN